MASTDKLRKASGSTRPVVTTLSLPKANGATTAELTSATGWNTSTGTDIVIYRRRLNTTTGLYEKIDGTQTDWTGQLTGITLSGMVLQAGTEPASGYAADGNTVVLAGPTAQWADDLIDTILTHADQDGTLKAGAVDVAAVLADLVVSTAKIANGAVTPLKLGTGTVNRLGLNAKTTTGTLLTTSYVTYCTLTATSTGGEVELDFRANLIDASSGAQRTGNVKVQCDGVDVPGSVIPWATVFNAYSTSVSLVVSHTPTAAPHTWTLQAQCANASSVNINQASLRVAEVKP